MNQTIAQQITAGIAQLKSRKIQTPQLQSAINHGENMIAALQADADELTRRANEAATRLKADQAAATADQANIQALQDAATAANAPASN